MYERSENIPFVEKVILDISGISIVNDTIANVHGLRKIANRYRCGSINVSITNNAWATATAKL